MLEQRDKGCPWTTTLLESLLSLLAAGRHLCWCWGGKLGQEDVRAWAGAPLQVWLKAPQCLMAWVCLGLLTIMSGRRGASKVYLACAH